MNNACNSMRRLGHILSIALITAGVLVIADVGITLAYQEPLSAIYSSIKQGEKESQLKSLEAEFLTKSDVQAIDRAKQTKAPRPASGSKAPIWRSSANGWSTNRSRATRSAGSKRRR